MILDELIFMIIFKCSISEIILHLDDLGDSFSHAAVLKPQYYYIYKSDVCLQCPVLIKHELKYVTLNVQE